MSVVMVLQKKFSPIRYFLHQNKEMATESAESVTEEKKQQKRSATPEGIPSEDGIPQ